MRRTNGKKHIIVDGKKQFAVGTSVTPDWFNDVQEELCNLVESENPLEEKQTQVKDAVDKKIKDAVDSILAALKQCRAPIGSLIQTFLTEEQLIAQGYIGWTLCDGQKVEGSQYQKLGLGNYVPDCRGSSFVSYASGTSEPRKIGDQDIMAVNWEQLVIKPGIDSGAVDHLVDIVVNTFIKIN